VDIPIAVPTDKSQLRKTLRKKRNSLSAHQQRQAAIQLDRQIARSGLLWRSRTIALYFANDGEIDPYLLVARLMKYRAQCYFPVMMSNKSLKFVRFRPGDKLKKNHYGIPEPAQSSRGNLPLRKPWTIQLVLLPLVGFDRHGGRLGMGGGFYDRTFQGAQKKGTQLISSPLLVGLAHHCQEVDQLAIDSWDIPLSKLITDKELITVPRHK
jgi:5-formyltetrahydrofolate cyclo-ligase